MKHSILALLVTGTLGVFASGALLVPILQAQAPSPEDRRGEAIDRFDENGDGQLDRAEFRNLRRFMAARRDARGMKSGANGRRFGSRFGGGPTPNLAEGGPPADRPGQKFRRPPRPGAGGGPGGGPDGKQRPRRPGRKGLLEEFDANGDGKLDREEREQMRAERKAKRGRRPAAPRKARRPGGPGKERPGCSCSCKQNEV